MQDWKKHLEQNDSHSWIELNKSALEHNIKELNKMRGPAVLLGFVIKANAYGHGLAEIAQLIEQYSPRSRLCVSTLHEAFRLAKVSDSARILSLLPLEQDLLAQAIRDGIELVVYSFNFLERVCKIARDLHVPARVHIKIDTGLGRLGFVPDEIVALIDFLKANKDDFVFVGCMTHYADSGSADHSSMKKQQKLFKEVIDLFALAGIDFELFHAAASGGYAHMDSGFENFVRVGTLWTGIWKSKDQSNDVQDIFPGITLRPVLQWKTRVMQIKELPAGSAVGYFGRYVTARPTRMFVLPVGYADGYPRELSNRGHVTIDGQVLPVVGLISMNMIAVDGTDCQSIFVGDEVLLMGGAGLQSATALSEISGAGSLDLFTRLSDTLPRFIVEE